MRQVPWNVYAFVDFAKFTGGLVRLQDQIAKYPPRIVKFDYTELPSTTTIAVCIYGSPCTPTHGYAKFIYDP